MARPHPLLIDLARGQQVDVRALTPEVIDSAQEHRVVGLLLDSLDGATAPRELLLRLEALDMSISAYQRRLIETAGQVHRRLSRSGIDHIFFKGLVEAHRTFPRPHQRPFSDLDVCLIPGASLSKACTLLAPGLKYASELDQITETGQLSAVGIQVDGFPIDVHTEPLRVGRRLQRPDLWWERTTTIDLPTVGAIRALDREASLVVFLVHQGRDRFRYLLGPAEFRFHLGQDIDWEAVESLSRAEGIWDQVSVAAEILASQADAPAPIVSPRSIRVALWRGLWSDRVRLRGPEGRAHHRRRGVWLMPLLARGRFLDSAAWILRSLVPSDLLLRVRHPNEEGPYLWRLVGGRIRRLILRRSASRLASTAGDSDTPSHRE